MELRQWNKQLVVITSNGHLKNNDLFGSESVRLCLCRINRKPGPLLEQWNDLVVDRRNRNWSKYRPGNIIME